MSNPAGDARAESGAEGASSFLHTLLHTETKIAVLLLLSHFGCSLCAGDNEMFLFPQLVEGRVPGPVFAECSGCRGSTAGCAGIQARAPCT